MAPEDRRALTMALLCVLGGFLGGLLLLLLFVLNGL